MTGWIYLAVAGVLEIVWASALKISNGFTRLVPSAIGIGSATASFFLLALALRTLPVGTAYAIWVGIGVGGVAIYGIVVLKEPVTPLRTISLALVAAGLAGLKIAEG